MFISSDKYAFAQKLTKIKNDLLIMSAQERFGVVSKQKEIYIGICIGYIISKDTLNTLVTVNISLI